MQRTFQRAVNEERRAAEKVTALDVELAEARRECEAQRDPLGLHVTLRRSAFEAMIRPELDMVRDAIMRALVEAHVKPEDVNRVLLTGGSAYIPAFRADLADTFGTDRLEQRDAFTAVVYGLGVRAQQLWGASALSPRPA